MRAPDNDIPENNPISKTLDDYFERRLAFDGIYETAEFAISALLALESKASSEEADPLKIPKSEIPSDADGIPHDLAGHLRRVASFSHLLALKLGLSERDAEIIKWVSPMHDIGKGAIPDTILSKPGLLTAEEFEIMKTHTQMGYDMLKDAKQEIVQLGALVAIQHQEKFDGSGYPNGLKANEIHLYSRITTVADVFDALASVRCYKKAWPVEDIVDYFQTERGRHFDPTLVDLVLENLNEFLGIRERYPDTGNPA